MDTASDVHMRTNVQAQRGAVDCLCWDLKKRLQMNTKVHVSITCISINNIHPPIQPSIVTSLISEQLQDIAFSADAAS